MPKFLFILEREYLGRFSAKVRISEQNRKEMPKFLFILEREYLGCFSAKVRIKHFVMLGMHYGHSGYGRKRRYVEK